MTNKNSFLVALSQNAFNTGDKKYNKMYDFTNHHMLFNLTALKISPMSIFPC